MHDIWNPWHGCARVSEGCDNCYMFYNDERRGLDPTLIQPTRSIDYPLQRTRDGSFRVKPGELIRICMTSDFCLPEADLWRPRVWDAIRARPDVKFFILTKRAGRLAACLPHDWGEGWDNVMLNVTCEDQRRADERIPVLMGIPAKHRGIMCTPFIGPVSVGEAAPGCLGEGGIEQVVCGGENYGGARPCDFAWVQALRAECAASNTTFAFIETGTHFVKDGRHYRMPSKRLQSEMAHKSGMAFEGRPIVWDLRTPLGFEVPPGDLYVPHYRPSCATCGSRPICNGCSDCGACGERASAGPR